MCVKELCTLNREYRKFVFWFLVNQKWLRSPYCQNVFSYIWVVKQSVYIYIYISISVYMSIDFSVHETWPREIANVCCAVQWNIFDGKTWRKKRSWADRPAGSVHASVTRENETAQTARQTMFSRLWQVRLFFSGVGRSIIGGGGQYSYIRVLHY